jgi:hypothetical protein
MTKVKCELQTYVDNSGLQKIIIVYTHAGKPRRVYFSTPLKTKISDWDKVTGRSKTDDSINSFLEKEVEKINGIKNKLISQGIDPDCLSVKADYRKLKNNEKIKKEKTLTADEILERNFLEWFDLHLVGVTNKNTYKVQSIVRNHINQYDKNVRLIDIDYEWLEGFKAYLSKVVSSQNTIYTYLKRIGIVLGTVRKHARKHHKVKLHIQDIKEDLRDTKGVEKYSEPVGLDYHMFLHLYKFNSFNIKQKHLEETRDLFVLGVAMGGLRVNDLLNIADTDIRIQNIMVDGQIREVYLFNYYEQKTKKFHEDIVILPWGVEVLKKYENKFPKRVVAAVFNRQLKDLAKILNWEHEVSVKQFNGDGSLAGIEKIKFSDLMTSKMMRKTRVSIDEQAGIDESISRMATGHDSKARDRYNVKTVVSMVQGTLKHEEIFKQANNKAV